MATTVVNESGLVPVGWRVLVKPDVAEEVTQGGIIVPDSVKDRGKYAMDKGTIVAMGKMAFSDRPDVEWEGRVPMVGDRVFFPKYGGVDYEGKDGALYRVMNDEEVPAIIEAE